MLIPAQRSQPTPYGERKTAAAMTTPSARGLHAAGIPIYGRISSGGGGVHYGGSLLGQRKNLLETINNRVLEEARKIYANRANPLCRC